MEDAQNLFPRLLNGWAVGGWANAIGAVLVIGDSSAVSGEFVAGFQRDADSLSCVVHVIRPDMVEIFVESRRGRPYITP